MFNCYSGGLPSCDGSSLVSTQDIYLKSLNSPQKQMELTTNSFRLTNTEKSLSWISKLFDLLQIFPTDFQYWPHWSFHSPEAEFLYVNWDKSLKSFPLCCSQWPQLAGFTPCTPLSKSGLKLVCNANRYYTETSSLRTLKIMPRTWTNLYVHEFGFRNCVAGPLV